MKAKSTLDDFLCAQAIRLSWLRAMNNCRENKEMIGFMNAQLNYLFWNDEVGRMLDKHIGELMDLVLVAKGEK